jgi:hypothetical protein
LLITALLSVLPLMAESRVLSSVISSLAYGPTCTSSLQLRNLSDRAVNVEVEGHRESGALVALAGLSGNTIRLDPHQQGAYKLSIEEETTAAWAKVRETIPSPDLSPALAISASTECVTGNQLRTAGRSVVFPTQNPWFAGDVADMRGNLITLINTSEAVVRATTCYSSGSLYSVGGAALQPVCSASDEMQIPPFNSRQFPVSREGNSRLSLKTQGSAIVLEMLRPLAENLRIYAVDSSIKFGEEVGEK